MTIKGEIAKSILKLRQDNNLTQKEFAEKIGVNNSAVSNWENGANSIDLDLLYKISDVFQVPLCQLFGKYGQANGYTDFEQTLLFAYRNNKDMQKAVNRLLKLE